MVTQRLTVQRIGNRQLTTRSSRSLGVASLYGFMRVSELIRSVEPSIHGRLLIVLFPGTKNENNYRLLDARDGWNYLANSITLHGGNLL